MHQICIYAKQLPFSKGLVPLVVDENDIYVNQMFNIEKFLQIDLKKMTSNLSDYIDHETETRAEDAKCEHTCIIILFLFCIYCFNKSLSMNDSTQKHQKI